jgi:ergothioneine biosynthesis protein EgtB
VKKPVRDKRSRRGIVPAAMAAGSLPARFADVRRTTAALAAPLTAEDCALQSMPDASPVKWHLGHTTWFFETFILEPFVGGYASFRPAFRVLFNSYYEGVGARHPRPERGMLSRPALEEVLEYRQHVEEALLPALAGERLAPEILELVELGLQHEQQHQELILADVKHLFSRNPLRPVYSKSWPLTPVHVTRPRWIGFGGGAHVIGHDGTGFAFDNESPRHRVWLEDFEVASQLATHGEYLAFMEDAGYRRPELWLSAGWECVASRGWQAPLYWERLADGWHTFTLHGMAPIEPNTPICHLSFYEADAFARWAGARLPTEAEWEVAAASAPRAGNFLESGMLHPLPLREAPAQATLAQAFGDVWEWTRSDYAPYPGFRPAAGAVGEYNGKFMANQYVLRGGSCASPASHVRPSYRNFFPADARWQFSGLRLARDA